MLQYFISFIFISVLPTQLMSQQTENVYLSFDESYISKFDSTSKSVEYDLYGITRDLIHEYVNTARLGETTEGPIAQSTINEFRQLFESQADIALDFEDPSFNVGLESYLSRASNRYSNSLIPLIVDAVSIANIEIKGRGAQYLVHLNMIKSPMGDEEANRIALKMAISIEGDLENEPSVNIESIEQGLWEKQEVEKRSHFHLLGLLGGKSLFLQGDVQSGFEVNNQWTAGLSYTFVYSTSIFNDRLSLVGGLRGKFSQFQTTASSGSILSNSGTPNELQIEFLNSGNEQMEIWSGEGLLGFDYAFSKSKSNRSGFIAAASYRLSSISNGNFNGAIEYKEIWDDEVTVRNVINCGLSSFEGETSVRANYQRTASTFNRNLGILFRPYYQFGKSWFRWRIAVEAQYMIGNAFQEGDPIFLNPIQETINGGVTQVQYGENSLLQSASSNLTELYLGLHLSYWLPVRPFREVEEEEINPSPFSKEKLEDFDGKGYLILNGNITDAEAAARIQKELGPATQFVWIINTTQLENVVIPGITELLEVRMENNKVLENVSFPRLQEVYDIVRIEKNDSLQEFHAPALEKLYNFEFQENPSCKSVQLPRLHSTGNEFLVSSNDRLEELALPKLEFTIGDFVVSENKILPSIDLPELTEFGGGLSINLNPKLQAIQLPKLKLIEGSCNISLNTALDRIALSKLQKIENGLSIIGHKQLQEVHFPQLESVDRYLDISSNQSLQKVKFPLLASIGSDFTLSMNLNLKESEWPELQSVEENLSINGQDSLYRADFPKLVSVGKSVRVSQNLKLQELKFPQLKEIEQAFLFSDNSSMDSLVLPNLEIAELIGLESNVDLEYFSSPSLSLLKGYSTTDLRYSGSGLWIAENARIKGLEFPQLKTNKGKLYLHRNHHLESWSLPILEFNGGEIIIRDHKNLDRINFPLLDTVMGNLNILLNNQLAHIPLPELKYIGGSLRIQNNPKLRSIHIPKLERIHENIYATFNALRSRVINQLLSIPAGSPQRDVKTIHLQGQIPKAAPYGLGIRHRELLQRQGSDVKTD